MFVAKSNFFLLWPQPGHRHRCFKPYRYALVAAHFSSKPIISTTIRHPATQIKWQKEN
jgi:hypothetical protein